MRTRKNHYGFTLTELIIVVVIIGILAVISMPNYQQYVLQSKLAEAYQIIGSIQKNEVTFFYENKEFYDLGSNPPNLNPPPTVAQDAKWAKIGYPAIVGATSYFSFKARAGKINSSGTELTTSTLNGNSFATLATSSLLSASFGPGGVCNAATANATTLGAVSQNNYDWIAIAAIGDLKNNLDGVCTAVALLVDVAGNDTPRSRGGFIVLNPGN